MNYMEIYLSLILLALIGFGSSTLAKRKGRNPITWFFIGFFFGLLGLLFLFFLPNPNSKRESIRQERTEAIDEKRDATDINPNSPYKEMQWYYLDSEHQSIGPLYYAELLQAWINGRASIKSFVWQSSMKDWMQIQNLPDLKELLEKEELRNS